MRVRPINTQAAWRGSNTDYKTQFMYVFSAWDIDEVDQALDGCRGIDLPEIGRTNFSLPTFGPKLQARGADMLDGAGVLLLRGFPRGRYTDDEMARIYVGLGSHLGRLLAQSWQGQLLGSVINISDVVEKTRGYNNAGEMLFHVDGSACDIVGLMCLRVAREGGSSRIVSVAAAHNVMHETRPELLEILYRGFYHRHHELDGLHAPVPIQSNHRLPFLSRDGDRLTCLASGCIHYAVQHGGVPMTDLEHEALSEWESICKRPDIFLDMDFEEGDIQFLNNRTILHGRTDYVDHAEILKRRHLLRIWIKVPEWPERNPSQVFMDEATCRHWQAKNRKPFGDLPSRYLAGIDAEWRRMRDEDRLLAVRGAMSQRQNWVGS